MTLRIVFVLIITAALVISNPAYADEGMVEIRLSEALSPGLKYLLSFADPGNKASFRPDYIRNVTDFVSNPKNLSALYYADNTFGAPSAYYEFDIQANLNQLLKYTHNPDIPSFMLMPSSVRMSYWSEINGRRQALPQLWRLLPGLDRAVLVKGVERVENTPDLFTGAYYKYDLNRALILFKQNGRNILISISKQADISGVGRKGLVLGPDEAWDYLYSGQKGLTKPGLGWVSSYMYDSFSVSVYDEIEPGKPLVRCGIFKWVRAGWAKFNMVNNNHIYTGLNRFATTFKRILEHPLLPDAAKLKQTFSHIENLSGLELTNRVKNHFKMLKEKYADDDGLSQQWIDDVLINDRYVTQLSKEEKKSILVVQRLKNFLRK